ncbi:MAG: LysM peptidoglycan-binding domain-containing protein, partial [Erysipelothrix sp.]|nr:LysM peptidoglycan-binding domain-containing protein [Erysipelothrix sp.]
LYSIARRYGVSVAQLKDWNELTSNLITVGDILFIINQY